ncbi:hypothetical protein ACPWZ6_26440 (plasmid) [Ralstonia pseudosolanacearum]
MITNKVTAFLDGISIEDLQVAVRELKELATTAVLPDGVVRRLSADLATSAGLPSGEARNIIESAVLRLAAYRWAGV